MRTEHWRAEQADDLQRACPGCVRDNELAIHIEGDVVRAPEDVADVELARFDGALPAFRRTFGQLGSVTSGIHTQSAETIRT